MKKKKLKQRIAELEEEVRTLEEWQKKQRTMPLPVDAVRALEMALDCIGGSFCDVPGTLATIRRALGQHVTAPANLPALAMPGTEGYMPTAPTIDPKGVTIGRQGVTEVPVAAGRAEDALPSDGSGGRIAAVGPAPGSGAGGGDGGQAAPAAFVRDVTADGVPLPTTRVQGG